MEQHRVRVHHIGLAYLCECGYIAVGLRAIKSHQDKSKKLKYGMKSFLAKLKRNDPTKVPQGFKFSHTNFVIIKTNHAEKYPQVFRHDLYFLKKYVGENIARLHQNQQKYLQLWGQRIKEIDSSDEEWI